MGQALSGAEGYAIRYTQYDIRIHYQAQLIEKCAVLLNFPGGLSQREVGALLKIGNGASVSKQLKKQSNVLETDTFLQIK